MPYVNEIREVFIPDAEGRNLRIISGEVDYKTQAVFIQDFTLYKENETRGNYIVHLSPDVGGGLWYGFNLGHKDEGLRKIFNDLRFRQAMSLALDRDEIVEVVHLGKAEPMQATLFCGT